MEQTPEQNPFQQYQIPQIEEKPLFNNFLQRGREGKNDWWRYLLGLIIVLIGGYTIIGQLPLLVLIYWAKSKGYINIYDPNLESKIMNPEVMHMDSNIIFLVQMFIFIAAMFTLWIVVRFIHKKPFIAIITSAKKIRWKRFAISAGIWALISIAGLYISMLMYPENYHFVFQTDKFLITLLIGLLFLPVQTWWEEFFMRGYLFQWIGMATKKAIWPVMITGFIFGLMHMMNPEVQAYGVVSMFPAYFLPGIFLGLMAAFDEGLESAMGMHFANNLFGTIGVTSASSAIQANTIWMADEMKPMADNITLLVSFLILMAMLYKINKWDLKKLFV